MRKLVVIALAVALCGALAATALAATRTVKVGDNWFVKSTGVSTVSIRSGDKLKFVWTGDNPHNARSRSINLGSRCKATRTSGSCTTPALRKRGTFVIYCSVHGRADQSMKVRIR